MKIWSWLDLEMKCQDHRKNQKPMPTEQITLSKKVGRDTHSNWSVKYVMNDLLRITERGEQSSRVIKSAGANVPYT